MRGAVFLGFSLGGSAGGSFLEAVGEMREVRRGSGGAATGAAGGVFIGTSGLVEVPRETSGDSEASFGGVSIVGQIGDGGRSCEMRSMRGVAFGLERREASGLDMERGAVGGVAVTELGLLGAGGSCLEREELS
jgi:hypothetical protein